MEQEATCSSGTVALAFVGGLIAGMAAGILLAPKSGGETRRVLREYAGRAEEEILERAVEARADLEDMIERGKAVHDGESGECRSGSEA